MYSMAWKLALLLWGVLASGDRAGALDVGKVAVDDREVLPWALRHVPAIRAG